jgi:hypothetical protein
MATAIHPWGRCGDRADSELHTAAVPSLTELFRPKQNTIYSLHQCCPTFLCARAQFTDAYGGAGATTLLLLLLLLLLLPPLNTYYSYYY